MSNDRLPATTSTSTTGDAARRAAWRDKFERSVRQAAETPTQRTVGVYERPARRAKLSLPLVVILILATLVSVVATARFLF
jgi:hypothetical protein